MSESDGALKPCPFCGKEAELWTKDGGFQYVRCVYCEARTPDFRAPSGAEKAWNNRHTPSFADAFKTMEEAMEKDDPYEVHDTLMGKGCPPPRGLTSSYEDFKPLAYKADDPKERYIARLEALLLKLVTA